jgi:CheY-like chemotaxis protein
MATMLIVEADPSAAQTMQRQFTHLGHTVLAVAPWLVPRVMWEGLEQLPQHARKADQQALARWRGAKEPHRPPEWRCTSIEALSFPLPPS